MNPKHMWMVSGFVALVSCVSVQAQTKSEATTLTPQAAESKEQAIDFEHARELIQKLQRGDELTPDEQAYVRRAMEARRNGAGQSAGQPPTSPSPREKTGLKPLSELTADERYKGQDGGLYGSGHNAPPDDHRAAAVRELTRIQPLNVDGQLASDGRIAFISISMSNATQEFSRFKRLADADPAKSSKLTIVDCAQGGQAMAQWAPPDARPWTVAEQTLASAMISPKQVQIAWIKLANVGPRGELEDHGRKLQRDTQSVIQNAKSRFPNLRIVYLSSRIYGGYATTNLNPEPFAYESAFPVRWLIQDQIKGESALNFDAQRGQVMAPLLLWGPYLWADGTTPRKGDKLVYTRDDLASDGTHPSESGRDKVAGLMLEFFKSDPLTKPWFVL